jgi:hypothetical protein
MDGWMDEWIMERGVQQGQLTIINIMTSHKSNPHNLHYLSPIIILFLFEKIGMKILQIVCP